MADMLKLFMNKRLTPNEPHHLEYIKGRLAAMKSEGQQAYEEYSKHYGFSVEVEVTENVPGEEPKKKRGRPAKTV